MKLNIRLQMKQIASIASFLVLAACAQNQGGGEGASCVRPQDINVAFQQSLGLAPVSGGQSQLIVKLADFKADYKNLKADLLREDGSVKLEKVDDDSVSIDMALTSPAKSILEKYIAENRISNIEADHATFALQTEEAALDLQTSVAPVEAASTETVNHGQANSKEIVVAVIDTGVDYTHKDLAPYMWRNSKEIQGNGIDDDNNGYVDDIIGWDFVNNDNKPMADDERAFHGTHVAGIIKMASRLAEKGLKIKIMALKYLNSSSSGRTSNAVRAIDYALKNGAQILNASWGSFSYSDTLAASIIKARKANALVIAAAGNGDAYGNGVNLDQLPFYPAAYQINNIISVAAVDTANVLAQWSNYGAVNVDVAAPGVAIKSTSNGNTYRVLSGTSMAAPYVAGVAAMIWAQRPDLNFAEVRKVISQTVTKAQTLAGKTQTGGAVNSDQALTAASGYIHDPNDFGSPEMAPNGICATL